MIDAGQAYRYARGAMWNLEAALPQLRAAAGGASKAAELTSVAAGHVERSVQDLARAAAHAPGMAGVHDAALGSILEATAQHARIGTMAPAAAADVVAAARLRIQASLDAIAPHLTADEQLLPLAPGSTIPYPELALIDRVDHARSFKAVSSVQRAQVQRILAEGTIDPTPVRWVGGYGNGNGAMPMVKVTHPDTPHLSVVAVHRPPTAQAAQEEFFARLTEHAGTDQHFAPVVRREDGSALVLAVPGGMTWEQGVSSGDDVADVMGNWYRQRFAGLTDEQASLAGRIDFDEARSMDFLAAQPDRNAGGILVDRHAGEVHYIDNGFAGRGETSNPLKPGLKSHFVGGEAGHAELHPVAARELGERLDDAALADAHDVLRRGPDGDLPDGHAFALGQDASDGYLAALQARRDKLVTGTFDYEPIELDANPLAHMDWLNELHGPRSF